MMYVSQIIVLYTLNLYSTACQLYLNKTRQQKLKKERNQQPWREAEGEQKSPHSGKLPHGGEVSWDRKGPSGDQRRMQQMFCGRQDKVRTARKVYTTALHIPA